MIVWIHLLLQLYIVYNPITQPSAQHYTIRGHANNYYARTTHATQLKAIPKDITL